MNRERIQKVIEALRSGAYEQTIGKLKENGCFCVLGVFADVYIMEHLEDGYEGWYWEGDVLKNEKNVNAYYTTFLPDEIDKYFGIEDIECMIAEWNDNGMSFNEIADKLDSMLSVSDPVS